jgi:hypothetical protein
MKQYTFNWEIQTLLEQFTAAFNDIVIKKYNNEKEEVADDIKVKFVYAPKQRVFAALSTPGPGGLTVPVISINQSSIQRDSSRVFNKLEGFNVPHARDIHLEDSFLRKIPQPVPVDITVNMTIITKFQADMDQIISNFVPYCDPYIVISSKLPGVEDSTIPFELRTTVIWSGAINYNLPLDVGATQAFRIAADTSFTIKGWLFKRIHKDIPRVFRIDTDFAAATDVLLDYSLLNDLSEPSNSLSVGIPIEKYKGISTVPSSVLDGNLAEGEGFTKTIYAKPVIKYSSPIKLFSFEGSDSESITNLNIDLYGKYFIQTKHLFVSGSNPAMFGNVSSFDLFDFDPYLNSIFPSFSGVAIPHFYILSDQHINFKLTESPKTSGYFDVLVVNDAGYEILSRSNVAQSSGIPVIKAEFLIP